MKPLLHAAVGAIALACIVAFWSASVTAELFLDLAAVQWVKSAVLAGLLVLIPAMAVTGASGAMLAGKVSGGILRTKQRRMAVAAANGLFLLLPIALYLNAKAGAGELDAIFYAIQALELAVGAVQLVLLGLNFRDGLGLRRRRRATVAMSAA